MKHTIFKRLMPLLLIVGLALSGCAAGDWTDATYLDNLGSTNLTATQLTATTANISTAFITSGNITSANMSSLNMSGDVLPTSNNTRSLGSTLFRWLTGWFVNLVSETHNTSQLNATTANISMINSQTLTDVSGNLTTHNASQTVSHNLSGLLALKANLASPTFTGTVTFNGNLNVNSQSVLLVTELTGRTTGTFYITNNAVNQWTEFISRRTAANAGTGFRFMTNSATNADTQRFALTSGVNTAVATWSNTTHTWSSYGAGTLSTDAAGVVTASSDSRLKNIVGAFTAGLKAILNLSPIEFKWKPQYGMVLGDDNVTRNQTINDATNDYTGFIAQDVMKYIPGAVGQAPDGNYTLSDRALIAALVNSIKELQAQIDALNVQLKNPAYDRTLAPIVGDAKVAKSAR